MGKPENLLISVRVADDSIGNRNFIASIEVGSRTLALADLLVERGIYRPLIPHIETTLNEAIAEYLSAADSLLSRASEIQESAFILKKRGRKPSPKENSFPGESV